jgi:hypothetical protein
MLLTAKLGAMMQKQRLCTYCIIKALQVSRSTRMPHAPAASHAKQHTLQAPSCWIHGVT